MKSDESVYGRNHPDTATTLHNLGLVYAKRNENKTALSYLEEALKIRTQTLGNRHPRVRRTKGYIDDIHRKISGGSSADSEEESETIASSDMLQVAAEVLAEFAYSHCGHPGEIVEETKKSLFGLISRKVATEKFRWIVGIDEMQIFSKNKAQEVISETQPGAVLDLQQSPEAIIRITLKNSEQYFITLMTEKKIPNFSQQTWTSMVSETIPMNPVLLKETLEKFLNQGILVKENNRLRYTGKE
ncbi:MAG: tetratricopeptide repeat protein [Desulfobacteraceae bacterium]|nr:tetratricopeptide repeat protein [Desulfobacteraceae bacterium]